MNPSRRELLRFFSASLALAGGTATLLSACAPPLQDGGGFFTAREKQLLEWLADAVLPRDARSPGGAALGFVHYVEKLCTALDGPTPFLYAGGPNSGRLPFPPSTPGGSSTNFPGDDFATPAPLDRVSLAAFRLELYGSDGVPGGGPNDEVLGKTQGLRPLLKEGLARLEGQSPLTLDSLVTLFAANGGSTLETATLSPEFRDTIIELVTESAFAAPEYGGNPGLAGWKLIHFDGDSAPLGYSQYDAATDSYLERPEAPLSTANPGGDPDPLDERSHAIVSAIIVALGGKGFSP